MKKVYIYLFILLAVILTGYFGYGQFLRPPTQETTTLKFETANKTEVQQTTLIEKPSTVSKISTPEPLIPEQHDLKVPFVSQAPLGIWNELYDNACEETSLILVHYYKKGLSLTSRRADEEIKEMVALQIKKYGRHKDLTAQETADLAREFYGYKNTRLKYDFTWKELKEEIAKGNPVIVPAAGRLLKNPYFRQPGPIYHMFVVRGYTKTEIIANDVGTRRGEKYKYAYSILDKAIHNWTGSAETLEQGKRVMLVIE